MAQDEDLATCSIEAQLLAVRILNFADDEGYFKAHPALIKASCFPLIESLNIPVMLRELSKVGYLRLGTGTDGKEYGQVVNFLKHQSINKPYPSKIKDLIIFPEHSGSDTGTLPAGMEWNGKEEHLSDSDESNAPVSLADQRNEKFGEWWEAYANKVGRKKTESAWRNLKWAKLGIEPADLIADTHRRHELDPQWLKGFQPNPLTYLNGERWNDDLPTAKLTLPKDRDELWRIRHAIGLQYEFDDLNSCHAEIHRTLKENPGLRQVAGL
jgi:hypothetical protein